MEFLQTIATGLIEHPTAWMLAIVLVVTGFIYRERTVVQKELVDTVKAQEAAHRETLLKIIPISEKLVESVEALEKITDGLLRRDG